MSQNSGYIIDNNANPVVLTLPVTCLQGSIIEVAGGVNGGATTSWQIAQNSGQSINIGARSTTVGTGGSLTATSQFDAVRLLCVVANTTFVVLSSEGNITVV